jgi:type I restriction enzyme M protein
MQWIAPSEKDTATDTLEKRLWDAADQLRANSGLKAQEYSGPILGLIFLRFAEVRFIAQRAKLEKTGMSARRGSRVDEPGAYHAEGILYLPAEARFDYLLNRPEAENIGAKVNAAMRDIEKQNPQLAGVLPKTYNLFTSTLLKELLKKVSEIPASMDYDAFGRIYEYFAVGPNMFYTVTLPCTLWFLDKGKVGTRSTASPISSGKEKSGTQWNASLPNRAETILFVDARHIYRQVDRAHREWTPAQIGFLANLVRLFRAETLDFTLGGDEARAKVEEVFGKTAGKKTLNSQPSTINSPQYRDVPGLCKAATLKEVEAQGWSLNPGRYVGVAAGEAVSDEDFKEQLETLNEELETLNAQARDLEKTIAGNVAEILET